jgi:sRNA-binding carbon storage regulator CsrA
MPTRTRSQRIGAQGQRLIQLSIETNGDWIVRGQEEDYGVDLEAELTVGGVNGQIVKLQVKSSEHITVLRNRVSYRISTSLIRYANTCRIPVILIIVSIDERKAWYLWLQKWIVELRQSGKSVEGLGKSVTVHIPSDQTLDVGLKGELKRIACWATDTQLVLSLADTLRTAASVHSQEMMEALSQLLTSVDKAYAEYPVEIIVDQVLTLGAQIWATEEGDKVSQILFTYCRNHGGRLNAQQIRRLIVRGEAVSRTGVNTLGILYDKYPSHIASLNLSVLFEANDDPRVRYYCKLREKYLGKTLLDIVAKGKDVTVDRITFDKKYFKEKWPNRGDSAFLDCVFSPKE